jgi:transcriptional regulator of acetoin/glycerol metabolism
MLRVGGLAFIHTDVKVIADTNRPLEGDREQQSFRGDLFYRLNGFPQLAITFFSRWLLKWYRNRAAAGAQADWRKLLAIAPARSKLLKSNSCWLNRRALKSGL